MKMTKKRHITFTLLALLLLVSCGGGSRVADGGIEGTGISVGSITDFGSIFVNGVEFDTNAASITLGGNTVSEGDLRLGMVVEVQGTISGASGTVITVVAEDIVKGPATSVTADQLVVLGQTVQVNELTNFDNSVVPSANDLVEVHGFIKGNGLIGATFVDVKTALTEFRVKGFVENTNTVTKTFTIGALTVDYSAADTGDLAGGNPVDGQLVEVRGPNTLGSDGILWATKVEPEGLAVTAADQAEVEGFVTSLASTSDFVVGSLRVVTTGSTIFAGGLQSEIIVGLKVEVEGTLAGGILTATKVLFRDRVKLESNVASVTGTAPNLSLMLKGLSGITITTDSQTEFKNGVPVSGDHVEIRGRVAGASSVVATRLVLRSPGTKVILQGPVDALPPPADPAFSILGVLVNTTGIPDANFEAVNDAPIDRAAFFVAIQPTDLVKSQGNLAGNAVIWDEIELED